MLRSPHSPEVAPEVATERAALRGTRAAAQIGPLRERLTLLLGRVHWWVAPVGPLTAIGLAAVVDSGAYVVAKGPLETLAVFVTAALAAACLLRFAIAREPYFLWAATVVATLMAREIRFTGASSGVYVALGLLAAVALRRLETFWPRLANRGLLTALMLGFTTYATSVAIDQRWARGLPGEDFWNMPVEETLEILGHAAIGLALLVSPRTRDPLPSLSPIPPLR